MLSFSFKDLWTLKLTENEDSQHITFQLPTLWFPNSFLFNSKINFSNTYKDRNRLEIGNRQYRFFVVIWKKQIPDRNVFEKKGANAETRKNKE